MCWYFSHPILAFQAASCASEGRGERMHHCLLLGLKVRTNPLPHVCRASSATSRGAPPLLAFRAPLQGINPALKLLKLHHGGEV